MFTSVTIIVLIWKLFLSFISGGILYSDVRNSIHQHKTMVTLISIGSLVIFAYSVGEVIWHIKGGDFRYPLLNYIFEVYIQKDAESIFYADHKKNLEGCQLYLEKYPKGRFFDQANECVEQGLLANDIRNFETAKSINTIAAYRQYIKLAGYSKYVPIAENHLHKLEEEEKQEEFEWTETRKTLDGCRSYAEQHPRGRFFEQAANCVKERKTENDNELFRKAENQNTISAYQEYLNKCSYSTCENKTKATQNITLLIEQEETAKWEAISSTLTLEQCQNHLTAYPNGKYFEKAKNCIIQHQIENDNASFNKAEKENTISAYREYLNKCSENTCEKKSIATQAIYQLEESFSWNSIANSLRVGECQAHLEKYPNGKYSEQAKSCIIEGRKRYCAENEEAAQKAGDDAAKNYALGTGVATGGGCSALLFFGFVDLGTSAALCFGAATAATAVAAANAKEVAYKANRDPQCL